LREVNHPDRTARGVPASATDRPAGLAAALGLLGLTVLGTSSAAERHCTLAHLPDIPVTMSGLRPMVHAQINGRDALLIADSGAFFSMIAPAAVQEYGLTVDPSFQGLTVAGVGGLERAGVARAATFTILGTRFPNVDFIAAGSVFGDAVGILGQNFFHNWDVEYDLANGVIRLVRPKDCGWDTPLAYWAAAAHKPYSVMDIQFATAMEPYTRSAAYLNGSRIRVLFDTGSPTSLMTLAAAKRAGITPESEGVTPGGPAWGIGHHVVRTWIARFKSFRIGDEEIENARLRFGDIDLRWADMLLGDDFFLSHRIYVASSQRRLYFTYNGGPVFDLTQRTPAQSAAEGGGTSAAAEAQTAAAGDHAQTAAGAASGTGDANAQLNEPTDAAGYARRGAASAARNDYPDAIADLTRACELAPTEPSYFYERGVAYWHSRRPDLALTDFDQAIKLKPDDVDALIARARLRAGRHAAAELIAADLDAADRALPKEADQHMGIGNLYEEVGQPAAAVVQYSKWIDSHPSDDLQTPGALNARCWARALTGGALDLALADCNAALKMRPNTPAFLDSRGLVYLRRGKYDKAIADYDAALSRQPKIAWSLYGRGLARMRKGLSDAGHRDISAATALDPGIAARARAFGITP
jgi:tetratricopeptide (TPR) repeat protein